VCWWSPYTRAGDPWRKAPLGDGTQPPVGVHASQQLDCPLTQAVPPLGGVHFEALGFVEHFTLPVALVLQQVTKPGLPQVDFAAHLMTDPLQFFGSSGGSVCVLAMATVLTHFTAWPWLLQEARG